MRARRTIVTEEALSVSPEVLGLPLASPWRRGAAIGLDTVLCTMLANSPSVLFALAAAWVLFRVSGRPREGAGYLRRSFRFTFRVGGAMMLFVVALSLWSTIAGRMGGDGERPSVRVDLQAGEGGAAAGMRLTGVQAVRFGTGVAGLYRAEDEAALGTATSGLLDGLRASGMPPEDARRTVQDLADGIEGRPWAMAVVDSVLEVDRETHPAAPEAAVAELNESAGGAGDSVVVAYAAAVAAGDSAAADSLRPAAARLLSADTVTILTGALDALDDERAALRAEVAELEEELEEGPGILAVLRSLSEDLGLGLGWFGLYFTATTAMWQGRTPGKRLLGIRVIALTGKPIGWWASFERFGGYAAGFATGLLGFLQIFWDDNRQAIHDKVAVTAVVRDRGGRES